MMFLPSFDKNKIAHRLVIYILIFSSIVTLLLTLIQLYRDYTYDISQIESRFNQIQATNKEVIEENYWLLNRNSIELLLDGLLRDQDIVYLEIIDEMGKIAISKGVIPQGDFKQRELILEFHDGADAYPLGKFRIVASLEFVYQRLLDTALIILFTQAIKTFLVSLFIIALVWNLITRHLEAISEYANKLELEKSPTEFSLKRNEGYWTDNDELARVVDSLNIMHKELYKSYRDLEHQSLHDHLTGLPNRRLLEDRLNHEILLSERSQKAGALLFVDIDQFKLLNDSLGHSVGDQLLQEISRRFESVVRKGDTVARLGGDEFVFILTMLASNSSQAAHDAQQIAGKIQRELDRAISLQNHDYHITASIGIDIFQGNTEDSETILKHADNAMFQAKADGRNTIRMYQSQMQKAADHRLSTERNLLAAINNHELVIYYQPKYDLNREIVSTEVLVRWIMPNGEMVYPADFIPIAEDSGLIIPIGAEILEMVFRNAAEEINTLKRAGLKNIAINISPRQFSDPEFTDRIISGIQKTGLDPELFMFELTEEAMVKDIDKAIENMNILKRHGFKLSIDDFGTGYSSLRYLKEFPLDELKIDQSFVQQIEANSDDKAIVSSIILMAKNLGLNVVAEGVEKEEQLEMLVQFGCEIFQGYLFSRPIDHQAFIQLLEAQIKSRIRVV